MRPSFRSTRAAHRAARRATALLLATLAASAGALAACADDALTAPGAPSVPAEQSSPDLVFAPAALRVAPGDTARTTVRVTTRADLRGTTFTLAGAPAGVSTRLEPAADGTSGTLLVSAAPGVTSALQDLTVHGAGANGKAWIGRLAVTVAGATARTLFVDAVGGSNANAGTQAKPFKTLGKALATAKAGDLVRLAKGQYTTTGSGDVYPLTVPAGVSVRGTLQPTGAQGTFLSPASSAAATPGLLLAGSAVVQDLELDVFGTALAATQGAQTVTHVNLGGNRTGLELTGTAKATLADVSMDFNGAAAVVGVSVSSAATLTMTRGRLDGGTSTCGAATGIALHTAARATVTDVDVVNYGGTALTMDGTAAATIQGANVTRTTAGGCHPQPSVLLFEATALTLNGVRIEESGTTSDAEGISTRSSGLLTLNGTLIKGHSGAGIRATGKFTLDAQSGTNLLNNGFGIDARSATTTDPRDLRVTGPGIVSSTFADLLVPTITLRKMIVAGGNTGVVLRGKLAGTVADLGTAADPGGNTFSAAVQSVGYSENPAGVAIVQAVGNTWRPSTQGADALGKYAPGLRVNGGNANAQGRNFEMPTVRTTIQF